MNAKTIELILQVLEVAGPIIAQVPTLGAKWIKNRNEVAAMVKEGRNPTPQEHARLSREMRYLTEALGDALARAEAAAKRQALAEADAPAETPVEVADVVEAVVTGAAEIAGAVVELSADDPAEAAGPIPELNPVDVAEEVAVDAETVEEVVGAFAEEEVADDPDAGTLDPADEFVEETPEEEAVDEAS